MQVFSSGFGAGGGEEGGLYRSSASRSLQRLEGVALTLSEYQKLAARTMKPRRGLAVDLSDYLLGLGGESGELQNAVKKMLYHGHGWDTAKIKEELGDVLWYVAAVATVIDADLDDIARENIEKLKKRYPDGFSVERSRRRGGGGTDSA